MTDKEFLIKLGKNIAQQRKNKGMSQMDVCAIINMETSNYSAIENGRQNAASLTLKKIADALKTDVKSFFKD